MYMKDFKIIILIFLVLQLSESYKKKKSKKNKQIKPQRQKIPLYDEVNVCPLIRNSKICTFFPNDNHAVLYSIKYGLYNLYSDHQISNCNLYGNGENHLIKHYILIRFYCFDMMKKEKLFEQSVLDQGVNVFNQYTLKSLENQSNKNFEIIMMIHNKINLNHKSIQKLYKIKSDIKINILRYKEINSFIEKNVKNIKYLITTRIDHDDLIYNGAVEEIQSKCNENIPLFYNGYDRLITMKNKDIYNTYKFYPKYNGNGSISIFQSLIINKSKINKIYNIYDLGNHTNQKNSFIKLYVINNFKFKEEYFYLNHLEDCCIYVKHEFNHSSFLTPNLEQKWHRTKIKIKKDKKWFIKRFGKFI